MKLAKKDLKWYFDIIKWPLLVLVVLGIVSSLASSHYLESYSSLMEDPSGYLELTEVDIDAMQADYFPYQIFNYIMGIFGILLYGYIGYTTAKKNGTYRQVAWVSGLLSIALIVFNKIVVAIFQALGLTPGSSALLNKLLSTPFFVMIILFGIVLLVGFNILCSIIGAAIGGARKEKKQKKQSKKKSSKYIKKSKKK
jgi:cellobiose-specific phosphotransferase system component IIC